MGRKIGDKKRVLLIAIVTASLFPVAGATTGIIGLWAAYELKDHDAKKKAKRYLHELENDGYIKQNIEHEKAYYKATKQGIALIDSFNVKNSQQRTNKKWDGTLKIVMFDIPSQNNRERDLLRRYLLKMKFVCIQKSVYATKHPCKEQVNAIKNLLNFEHEVLLFESTSTTLINDYNKKLNAKKRHDEN